MLALNGADPLNGPRQWGSLLFCLVIVLSLQRAEGSTEETGSSYTKVRILPCAELRCAAPPTAPDLHAARRRHGNARRRAAVRRGARRRDAAAAWVAVPPLRFRRGGHQRALRLRRQPDRQHSRSAARPVRAGVLERAGWRR